MKPAVTFHPHPLCQPIPVKALIPRSLGTRSQRINPWLAIQPRDANGKALSKERIAPMIRDTPALAAIFAISKARIADNTIEDKLIQPCFARLAPSWTQDGGAGSRIFADQRGSAQSPDTIHPETMSRQTELGTALTIRARPKIRHPPVLF